MWKLGVVSYLNSLPLYQTLLDEGAVEVVRVVPAKLAGMLDAGECDAALMPIVDHLRGHGDGIVSDACIGADGFVRSVMLFSKVPVEEVRSVAADISSHTSVALLRVLFRDLFHIDPEWKDAAPNLDAMLSEADAALIIGDPALEAYLNSGKLYVTDLATAWKQLAGLPFVFAAWTAREGLSAEQKAELGRVLSEARDLGTTQVPALAVQHARGGLLTAEVIESYLSEAIRFQITESYAQAIQEFGKRLC